MRDDTDFRVTEVEVGSVSPRHSRTQTYSKRKFIYRTHIDGLIN